MTNTKANDEIFKVINSHVDEYLTKAPKRGYICPLCGSGSGKNGTGMEINPHKKDKLELKCFACNFSGDLIDLYKAEKKEKEGLIIYNNKAIKDLCERFNIERDKNYTEIPKTPKIEQNEPLKEEYEAKDYTEYYEKCHKHLHELLDENQCYRGIDLPTLERFKVGYDKKENIAVLPNTKEHYVKRYLNKTTDDPDKYNNEGKVQIFNADAIYSNKETVYVCEGIFDALSYEMFGLEAIALNSASNTKKLINLLQSKKPRADKIFIRVLDKDKKGEIAEKELVKAFNEMKILSIQGTLTGYGRDINEELLNDKNDFGIRALEQDEQTKERFKKEIEEMTYKNSISTYLKTTFKSDIEKFKEGARLKTGFSNLDEQLKGFYSGLYVIGGISSVGKTTFVYQLADQIAQQSQKVLYFSLEQSKLELVSKSLARTGYQEKNGKDFLKGIDIKNGKFSGDLQDVIDSYTSKVGNNLNIIEGNFDMNTHMIRDEIDKFKNLTGQTPVVFIDYLQIIAPNKIKEGKDGSRERTITDAKLNADMNVSELKRLSRDLNTPIVIISSFNRTNYLNEVSFESFKESGGIEYSSDVVFGLQLSILRDEEFLKEKDINEKRKLLADAKANETRKVDLVCLKNRNGKSSFTVSFDYIPSHDIYEPTTITKTTTETPKTYPGIR